MDTLRSYIETQLSKDQLRREETLSLIRHALPLFTENAKLNSDPNVRVPYWPYERTATPRPHVIDPPHSHSNALMIAAALRQIQNMKLPDVYEDCVWHKKKQSQNDFFKGSKSIETAITLSIQELLPKPESPVLKSETYGDNSVLALSWLFDLLKSSDTAPATLEGRLKEAFQPVAYEKLHHLLVAPYYSPSSPSSEENSLIDRNHAFPLLKTLHLYELLGAPALIPRLGHKIHLRKDYVPLAALEKQVYHELLSFISLAFIENSQFDAAELVFSLEAYLIVRRLQFKGVQDKKNLGTLLCDEGLLRKVFSILSEKQKVSTYWRPLTPFVSDEKGRALLPISAELVLSLLRVCELLGPLGDRLFADYCGIFERYFDWLKSRIVAVQPLASNRKVVSDKPLCGWCSEHTYKPNVIQLWQTSQIVLFLAKYYIYQRKKTAADALAAANLTVKKIKSKPEDGFWVTKPYGSDKIHVQIKHDIDNSKDESASFLLYGPPGTGKTFFAEMIAAEKGWRLLELSPGDFIADGTEGVENKAKNLFQVLREQENLVIIFDEIDRLLLDRSSKDYKEQADMFQFMVASLLTKFKELRETPRIIFLICTNYAHRIDPAIVRPGRIDRKILVLPPDRKEREAYAEKQLKKHLGIKITHALPKNWQSCPGKIAAQTALYSYVELNQLCKDFVGKVESKVNGNWDAALTALKRSPAILDTVSSYHRQADEANGGRSGARLPLDEYLMCLYALSESKGDGHSAVPDDIRMPQARWEDALNKVNNIMGETTGKNVKQACQYLVAANPETQQKGG